MTAVRKTRRASGASPAKKKAPVAKASTKPKKKSSTKSTKKRSTSAATESPAATGEVAAPSAAGKAVVVRKYENRRLYDTSASKYINLDRVAEMVREGVDVRVLEVKTEKDVTRQVLTQIIVESSRGKGGPPLEFLRDLVRANDKAHRDFFQWYLAGAAEVYQTVRENWEKAYRLSPAGRLASFSKLWRPAPIAQTLTRILSKDRSHSPADDDSARGKGTHPASEAQSDDTADGAELDELRSRLERLERRLADS
jgi:polyhydroxyalkanoate synthesis repressor PhaR